MRARDPRPQSAAWLTGLAPLALAFCILLLAVASLGALAPSAAAQDWTVLEYDEDGRVIGTRRGGEEGDPDTDGFGDPGTGAAEPGQILLADPSDAQVRSLEADGFAILQDDRLDSLEIRLVQMRVPEEMSVAEALRLLGTRYPDLLATPNDLLDMSGGPRPQLAQVRDFTREISGWGNVPDNCGQDLKLGQIDGFVDVNHPALRGRNLIFRNWIEEGREPAAEDHGTAVAVILIGRAHLGRPAGLLPGATLYAANIFEKRDGRETGNLAALVRAVDWLASEGVGVANLSISGRENAIMRLAINRALLKDLILVAAAGNNGPNAPPAWPAAHPNAFAVTAVDRQLRLYRHANRGGYIDFAAPGVDVPTQTPHGDRPQSGTSFAAPFVTAMVALHLQAGFEPDPDLIRRSLQRYTTDLGSEGKDDTYGWGLVRLKPNC